MITIRELAKRDGRQLLFIGLIFFGGQTQAIALRPYYVTDLGDLPGGTVESYAYGVNSYGQVVGGGSVSSFDGHAFLWTPDTPNGRTGSMVDLGDFPGGANNSIAWGINSQGQVVGDGSTEDEFGGDLGYAFLWTPTVQNGTVGSMVAVNVPTQGGSVGYGINSFGQVVGYTTDLLRAYVWTPNSANGSSGVVTDLGDGANSSTAQAINIVGQVVGYRNAGGDQAFLWTPTTPNGTSGSMLNLGRLPGDIRSYANDINAYGQVVGRSYSSISTYQAFLWTPSTQNGTAGSMVALDDGPFYGIAPQGINSQGQVVGWGGLTFPPGGTRAFVWTPTDANGSTGATVDLNTLLDPDSSTGWILWEATGINDKGQIVGYGMYDPDGPGGLPAASRAYLLTPIPEPSTGVLAILGAMLLIRKRRVV